MCHTLYYDAHYSLPTSNRLLSFFRLLRHERRHSAVLVSEILLRDTLQIGFGDPGVILGGREELAIIAEEDLVASERIGLAVDRLQRPVEVGEQNVLGLLQFLIGDRLRLDLIELFVDRFLDRFGLRVRFGRSEERRVGKECRSAWSAC